MIQDLYIYRCRCKDKGCSDCGHTGIISANQWQDLPEWKREEIERRENFNVIQDSVAFAAIIGILLYVFFYVL